MSLSEMEKELNEGVKMIEYFSTNKERNISFTGFHG